MDANYRRIRSTRECSTPECTSRIPSDMVACRGCWDTVPKNLQDAFYRSRGKSTRYETWNRVERYLAIRALLRTKAVTP